MASQLDICNLALSHIACGAIQSLQDGSESARILNLHYDTCRQDVLRDFPWSFARVTDALDLTPFTHPKWDYCYSYPMHCVRILRVFAERFADDEARSAEFETRLATDGKTKLICTNCQHAYAEYIYDVTDTTVYDSLFLEALSYKLAFEINRVKTGDAGLTGELQQRYQLALAQAQHAAVMENRVHIDYPNRYLVARGGKGWRHRR